MLGEDLRCNVKRQLSSRAIGSQMHGEYNAAACKERTRKERTPAVEKELLAMIKLPSNVKLGELLIIRRP